MEARHWQSTSSKGKEGGCAKLREQHGGQRGHYTGEGYWAMFRVPPWLSLLLSISVWLLSQINAMSQTCRAVEIERLVKSWVWKTVLQPLAGHQWTKYLAPLGIFPHLMMKLCCLSLSVRHCPAVQSDSIICMSKSSAKPFNRHPSSNTCMQHTHSEKYRQN